MIASLRGRLLERGVDSLVIEAGGVGYLVTPTAAAMRALPALGAEARLSIYTHSTQDGPMQLFGFPDADERRLFETLLSVQGVGPKVAVAILSGLPPSELVKAIGSGDVTRLTQIRGIGRKIAERMCVELREKIGAAFAGAGDATGSSPLPGAAPTGRLGEVHGALISLGYRPPEFETVLRTLDPTREVPDLVKDALAALRKR